MYVPSHFLEPDHDVLFDLIAHNSFGTLITCDGQGPQISHLPFIVDRDEGKQGTLYGHFARGNPHWKSIGPETRAVAVFLGPHSYISPNWYHDRSNVPTWNYTAVHLTGRIEFVDDKQALLDIVTRLTDTNERGLLERWQVESAEKNLDKLLSAIVGFRVPIDNIEGKFKLSQNRTEQDQLRVIAVLADADDPTHRGVAELMQARLKEKTE